ncbi:MAG TPA: PQQ-binding-like beta-propeller repeat protein [Chloroflexia bacterium]|nr:PQQ-binding-like beta-propeller repeat protein [Chloroflexia bacterium]
MKEVRRRAMFVLGWLSLLLAACGDSGSAVPPVTSPAATSPAVTTAATSASATLSSPSATTTIAATTGPVSTSTAPATSAAVTTAPAGTIASTGTNADWPTYHRDNARTGYVSGVNDPRSLSKKWSVDLDGAVYAEPLVVGSHLLVATEGNSLYSLNTTSGQIEWHTNIASPVPRSALPCGNIDPLGITGTPVYDPASGLVFAIAEISGPAHQLVGVDIQNGQVRLRRSADPPGMDPRPHQQRAALALSQGMVYIAYGGFFGDCGNYHGMVVASRTDGQGDLLSYQVPTAREGGIWAPPGPAIDSQGRVFVSVGNGSETNGAWDHSDSVLRLSPDLKLEDGFAPQNWAAENARDADLGSLAPVLLPNGLVFIAGKGSTAYSLKADKLGGVGGQLEAKSLCSAYGGAASVGNRIFVPCTSGLLDVTVAGDGKMTTGWQANSQIDGSPIVAGQTVYTVDRNGTLYALNSENGQPRASLVIGPTSRFATPTVSGGLVFVGTMKGVVAASIQ